MFTKITLKELGILFQLGELIGTIPYSWEGSKFNKKPGSRFNKFLWFFSSASIFITALTTMFSLVISFLSIKNITISISNKHEKEIVLFTIHVIITLLLGLGTAYKFTGIYYKDEIMQVTNEVLKISYLYQEKKLKENGGAESKFDVTGFLIKSFHRFGIIFIISVLALYWQFPCGQIFISSLFLNCSSLHTTYNFYAFLTFGIFLLISLLHLVTALLFEPFIHMAFIDCFLTHIRDVLSKVGEVNLQGFTLKYRHMQLLVNLYNSFGGRYFFTTTKVLIGSLIIFANVCTVRFSRILNFHIFILFPLFSLSSSLFLAFVYPAAGSVYELSRKIRAKKMEFLDLERKREMSICRATFMSFRAFGIKVGSFYVFKRHTFVEYFDILLNGTANLLLMI